MSREDPQLRVRIPAGLKETLEQKAKENKRTLTAEIVSRLEETTKHDDMFESHNGFERIASDYEFRNKTLENLLADYESNFCRPWSGSWSDDADLRLAVVNLYEIINRLEKKQ
ncbi:Arc family DNA-binding protein [Xenorhabdus bovienii]|uniref:Arc family DNA-binding protein n=1 Tax=Xenorhabdus bovienii TaxID=40576 RepID=UPI00056EBBB6|nr:Arc family DNA-binding protein [Xenorhabdus bovienii]